MEKDENIVISQKRDETKKLKRDKNNNIVLTQGQYDLVNDDIGQYASAHAWIELKKANVQCLVKNLDYNSVMGAYDEFIKINGKEGLKICKYNNVIIPYIGTEIFGVDTVEYYFTKFSSGKQKILTNPNLEYLVTLDEKSNGEEIWEGTNILMDSNGEDTLIFSERMDQLKKFLELRHIPTHKTQEILDEFIRQEIFKKSIEYVDNHNVNWSLGVNGKMVRLFPAYDFDFCTGVKNKTIYETKCDNGLSDIKSFINQYKEKVWMKKYIKEVIQDFDIDHVFETSEERTVINIPDDIRTYFSDFYSKKKEELEAVYKEIFEERKQGDDEICI